MDDTFLEILGKTGELRSFSFAEPCNFDTIHVATIDDYLHMLGLGYSDIIYEGNNAHSLLAALKVRGESDEHYRYQYARELNYLTDQHELAHQIFLGLYEDGFKRAAIGLSYDASKGYGMEVDDAQSLRWLEEVDPEQYPVVYLNLGVIYARGRGVEKDLEKAAEYYRKGMMRGVASCGRYLASTLADIAELKKQEPDHEEIFEALLQGAIHGNIACMDNVAFNYRRGLGCSRDYAAAIMWEIISDLCSHPEKPIPEILGDTRIPGRAFKYL